MLTAFLLGSGGIERLAAFFFWVLGVLNALPRSNQRGMPSVWLSSLGIGEITAVGVSPVLKHVRRVGIEHVVHAQRWAESHLLWTVISAYNKHVI